MQSLGQQIVIECCHALGTVLWMEGDAIVNERCAYFHMILVSQQ